METKPGFDLERAISEWRWKLSRQPAVTADEVRELETHLRDSVAELVTRGLSEQEAFWVACHRLGKAAELGEEFAASKGVASSGWLAHRWTKPLSLPWRIALWAMISLAGILFAMGSIVSTAEMRFNDYVYFTELVTGTIAGVKADPGTFLTSLGALALGLLILKFYLLVQSQKARLLVIGAGLAVIGFSMDFLGIDLGGLNRFQTLAAFVTQVPILTLRVLTGFETGEFFQDRLLIWVAFGWWLMAWGILAVREFAVLALQLVHTGLRKFRSEMEISR